MHKGLLTVETWWWNLLIWHTGYHALGPLNTMKIDFMITQWSSRKFIDFMITQWSRRSCQGGSHVARLNLKTSRVGVYKCLSLIVGFAVTVAIWPREVVSGRDFILCAVATFLAMSHVGIYPCRASSSRKFSMQSCLSGQPCKPNKPTTGNTLLMYTASNLSKHGSSELVQFMYYLNIYLAHNHNPGLVV